MSQSSINREPVAAVLGGDKDPTLRAPRTKMGEEDSVGQLPR